ncbi:MAG: pantetheine-phosphate adenylyltransferase [Clostridia bacterium]|nr:pantetheine-phosphate adenylyltransferase [Clostridia bacterium]
MTGLFCGSFCPITKGHMDTITRASKLCDTLYVVVANNVDKKYAIDIDDRCELARLATRHLENVKVVKYEGLIADFCKTNGVGLIIKSGRNALDLQYEMDMADVNKDMCGVETVYFAGNKQYQSISSSLVRELATANVDITPYVPSGLAPIIMQLFAKNQSKTK